MSWCYRGVCSIRLALASTALIGFVCVLFSESTLLRTVSLLGVEKLVLSTNVLAVSPSTQIPLILLPWLCVHHGVAVDTLPPLKSDTVIVLLSNRGYWGKLVESIETLRDSTRGAWDGDIVLLPEPDVEEAAVRAVSRKFNATAVFLPQLNLTAMLSANNYFGRAWKTNLSGGGSAWYPGKDDRQWTKTVQWQKLRVFHTFFTHWERLVYIDVGTRAYHRFSLALDEMRGALDDGKLVGMGEDWSMSSQFDPTADTPALDRLKAACSADFMRRNSLQSSFLVFDTRVHIDGVKTLAKMEALMVEHASVWYANEQALLNLYLQCGNDLFVPVPSCASVQGRGLCIFSYGPPGNNESRCVESILVKGPTKCRPFL